LVGLLVGLSKSQVVAGAIAAAFSLATAALQRLLPNANRASPQLPLVAGSLTAFAFAMTLGVLGGITLRVNDALDFTDRNLRRRYESLGFSSSQVDLILDRCAQSSTPDFSSDGTALFSHTSTWRWADLQKLPFSDSTALLDHVAKFGSPVDRDWIIRMRASGKHDPEILDLLKTLYLATESQRAQR